MNINYQHTVEHLFNGRLGICYWFKWNQTIENPNSHDNTAQYIMNTLRLEFRTFYTVDDSDSGQAYTLLLHSKIYYIKWASL